LRSKAKYLVRMSVSGLVLVRMSVSGLVHELVKDGVRTPFSSLENGVSSSLPVGRRLSMSRVRICVRHAAGSMVLVEDVW